MGMLAQGSLLALTAKAVEAVPMLTSGLTALVDAREIGNVAESVQRRGGFVAKYMGDGVLVYFGYPQAHEDDAERAVRAGLELVAAVGASRRTLLSKPA